MADVIDMSKLNFDPATWGTPVNTAEGRAYVEDQKMAKQGQHINKLYSGPVGPFNVGQADYTAKLNEFVAAPQLEKYNGVFDKISAMYDAMNSRITASNEAISGGKGAGPLQRNQMGLPRSTAGAEVGFGNYMIPPEYSPKSHVQDFKDMPNPIYGTEKWEQGSSQQFAPQASATPVHTADTNFDWPDDANPGKTKTYKFGVEKGPVSIRQFTSPKELAQHFDSGMINLTGKEGKDLMRKPMVWKFAVGTEALDTRKPMQIWDAIPYVINKIQEIEGDGSIKSIADAGWDPATGKYDLKSKLKLGADRKPEKDPQGNVKAKDSLAESELVLIQSKIEEIIQNLMGANPELKILDKDPTTGYPRATARAVLEEGVRALIARKAFYIMGKQLLRD